MTDPVTNDEGSTTVNQSIELPSGETSAPVMEPVPGPRPRRTVSWVNVALALAVLVAIGGVAFAAGRLTAPATAFTGPDGFVGRNGFQGNGNAPSFAPGQGGFGPGGFNGGFAAGGLSIEGTVDSVDADSMTIRLASGETIEVALDGDTTYHAQANATASDIESGGSVIVRLQLQRGPGTGAEATARDVTVVPAP